MSHPGAPWWVLACYYLDFLGINWLLLAGPLSSHPATEGAITCFPSSDMHLWTGCCWISNSLCRTLLVLNGRHPFCRLTEAGRIIHGRLQRWLKIYENVKTVEWIFDWYFNKWTALLAKAFLLFDFSCQLKVSALADLEVKCWERVQSVWGGNECLSFFISSSVTVKVLWNSQINLHSFLPHSSPTTSRQASHRLVSLK